MQRHSITKPRKRTAAAAKRTSWAKQELKRMKKEALAAQLEALDTYFDQQQDKANDTHPDWIRLADAIAEITTNEATPTRLYNDVMAFLNDNSSELWNKLMVTPPMIQRILVAAAGKEESEARA